MRRIKKISCVSCGKESLEKNEIGINKKLLGEQIESFYCMDCLADYLGVSVQDIWDVRRPCSDYKIRYRCV